MAGNCLELPKSGDYGGLPGKFYNLLREYQRAADETARRAVLWRVADTINEFRVNDEVKYYPDKADGEVDVKGFRTLVTERLGESVDKAVAKGMTEVDKGRAVIMDTVRGALRLNDMTRGEGAADGNMHPLGYETVHSTVAAKVDDDLSAIFGKQSAVTKNRITSDFHDRAVRACQFDQVSRSFVRDGRGLNESIWRDRASMFADMVRFLKSEHGSDPAVASLKEVLFANTGDILPSELTVEDMEAGGFDTFNFLRASALFEKHVIKDAGFASRYADAERGSEANIARRTESWRKISGWLLDRGGEGFRNMLQDEGINVGGDARDDFVNMAYEGRMPSYAVLKVLEHLESADGVEDVKGFAEAFGFDPVREMREVMLYDADPFADAVRKYIYLQHYDEMLSESLGEVVSVGDAPGRTYRGGQYTFRTVGGGNVIDWMEGENIDSDRYTTRFLRQFLSGFDVYDYRTGQYMDRGIDSSSLLRAFSRLLRGIQSGRYELNLPGRVRKNGQVDVQTDVNAFMRHLDSFSGSPTAEGMWLLEQMFGVPEARYGRSRLIDRLGWRCDMSDRLTDSDISELYSFYNAVANGRRASSLIGVVGSEEYGRGEGLRMLNIMFRHLASNEAVRWSSSRTGYDGSVEVGVERGYVSTFVAKQERVDINSYSNTISSTRRTGLQDEYGFSLTTDARGGQVYRVRIGGDTDLTIRTAGRFGIMYGDEKSGDVTVDMTPDGAMGGYWDLLNRANPDLVAKAMRNAGEGRVADSLELPERTLYSTLEFVDDFLGTGFLTNSSEMLEVLRFYKDHYMERSERAGLPNYMMPLVKMAMRGAYANSRYLAAAEDGQTLGDYISSRRDSLYDAWRTERREDNGEMMHIGLTQVYGDFMYDVASKGDNAVAQLAEARSITRGENNSGNLRGPDGKRFPTGTVNKWAVDPFKVRALMRQRATGLGRFDDVLRSLTDITHAFVVAVRGQEKQFKALSGKEHIFDAVINRFFSTLERGEGKGQTGAYVFNLPMSYSDKGTQVMYRFNLDVPQLKNNLFNYSTVTKNDFFSAYSGVFGRAFTDVLDDSRERVLAVLPEVAARIELSAEREADAGRALEMRGNAGEVRRLAGEMNGVLKLRGSRDEGERARYDAAMDGVYDALRLTSERTLLDAVADHNAKSDAKSQVRLERDYDYRVVRDPADGETEVVVANELMRMYRTIYGDKAAWDAELLRNGRAMVAGMLDEGVHFSVVDPWDSADYHNGGEPRPNGVNDSDNAVYRAVEWYCDKTAHYQPERYTEDGKFRYAADRDVKEQRKENFYKTWVDTLTGKLVLAKQGGRNVIESIDYNPMSDAKFEVNPMLEYFQLVDGMLSRTMEFVNGGTELNCPVKGGSEFARLFGTDAAGIAAAAGIDAEEAAGIRAAVDTFNGTDDLARYVAANAGSGRLSERALSWLRGVTAAAWAESAASAQQSNAKRFGAAVSTVQSAHQGLLDGAPDEVYVTTYGNIETKCYNYSGETRLVDVYEGSTFMSPFMWRWANAMYGDHASGEQEKSMLYTVNDARMDATLFKHVAVPMTVNSMRNTERPAGDGMTQLDIFKKMHNVRWLRADGSALGLDLLHNGLDPNVLPDNEHVFRRVFGGRWLYYRGKGGVRRRIETLSADWLRTLRNDDGTARVEATDSKVGDARRVYCTVEGDGLVRMSDVEVDGEAAHPTNRVYHLFYDVVEKGADGKVKSVTDESRHVRCGSAEEAMAKWAELEAGGNTGNVHTINSIYELFKALGGIECVDEMGRVSERSLDVTHGFINYTVSLKDTNNAPKGVGEYDQAHFSRPLARFVTAYASPPSTEKKGSSNVNPSGRMLKGVNEGLDRYPVRINGLGLQQDAGHALDNVTLALPTQILTALSTNGVMPEEVREINDAVGRRVAVHGAELLDVVRKLVRERDKFEGGKVKRNGNKGYDNSGYREAVAAVYGAAVRIMSDNLTTRGGVNVEEALLKSIKPEFDKHSTHLNDAVYMPFSSSPAYRAFIGTLSNFITNKCVRIRLNGAGFTIAPSYDMVKLYHLQMDGREMKLMPEDVLTHAEEEYRGELLKWLAGRPEYDRTRGVMTGDAEDAPRLEDRETQALEDAALALDRKGEFSRYYTAETDLDLVNDHLRSTFLEAHRRTAGMEFGGKDREWFLPGDVVDVVNGSGRVVDTVRLDIDNYYDFIDGVRRDMEGNVVMEYGKGWKYRENTVLARDLRPETMRWKYHDTALNADRWTNYFALDHVRDAIERKTVDPHTKEYRKRCDDMMHMLSKGWFSKDGKTHRVIGGAEGIERHEAETVLGNLYARQFGIRNGDTLHTVMRMGAEYFRRYVADNLRTPADSSCYDLALLSNSGRHALLKFGAFSPDETSVERRFENERVHDNGEIWSVRGGREQFLVGRWVDYAGDDVYVNEGGRLTSRSGRLDRRMYKVATDPKTGARRVQERIDLVRRYVTQMPARDDDGRVGVTDVTVYSVADKDTWLRAYYGKDYANTPVRDRPLGKTVRGIFSSGDYATAEICRPEEIASAERGRVGEALEALATGSQVADDVRDMMEYQAGMAKGEEDNGRPRSYDAYQRMKEDWYDTLSNERWSCFQDSLKFISGRIPATGLQSFMDMECVGWTGRNSNMAYVSHFQIYLQGSDFDADKANILAQSYDSTGRYIGWSPYFDMSSLRTLEESKRLPIALGMRLESSPDGADISAEAERMLLNSEIDSRTGALSVKDKNETERVEFLKALGEALRKAAKRMSRTDGGRANLYRMSLRNDKSGARGEAVRRTLERCAGYSLKGSLEEEAYNNAIQAKMWYVARDIRNLVSATTPVQTTRHQAAARVAPKSATDDRLDNANPIAKFVRMRNAQGAKQGVGIGANGKKAWDRIYQYVMQALTGGDEAAARRTLFRFEADGISGRAGGADAAGSLVVDHIPDLNFRDRTALGMYLRINPGAADPRGELPANVIDMLSEFINVETDEEKLGISSKLNITPKTASLYTTLYTLGVSVEDAAAFMTSPYADELVRCLDTDLFGRGLEYVNVKMALDAAVGKVSSKAYLHGDYTYSTDSEDMAMAEAAAEEGVKEDDTKIGHVKSDLIEGLSDKRYNVIGAEMERILMDELDDYTSLNDAKLDDLVMAYVLASARDTTLNRDGSPVMFSKVIGVQTDIEAKRYAAAVDESVARVRAAALKYSAPESGTLAERCARGEEWLLRDRESMRRVNRASNELTTAAVSFLSFNGGVPYGDAETLTRLSRMGRIVSDAESEVGLRADKWEVVEVDNFSADGEQDATGLGNDEIESLDYVRKVVRNIRRKGTYLSDAEIKDRLDEAKRSGLMGAFDIRRALRDQEYRRAAVEYMEPLKTLVNTLDMVWAHPDYALTLELFGAMNETAEALSMKRRLVNELTASEKRIDEGKVMTAERVADRLIGLDYMRRNGRTVTLNDAMADGFTEMWDGVRTSTFDLSTDSGQAGFARWVISDFVNELRRDYADNALVRNLVVRNVEGRDVLTTRYDMLDVDRNRATRRAYDAMADGMSELSEMDFKHNGDLKVTDVLFLYDLVENAHRVTRTALAPLFETAAVKGERVRFNNWVSKMDRVDGYVPEYNRRDIDIMTAPTIEEHQLPWAEARVVKVLDDAGGYRLMERDDSRNTYSDIKTNEFIEDRTADPDLKRRRLMNYLRWSPMQMPRYMKGRRTTAILTAETPDRADVKALLVSNSMANIGQYVVIC